MTDQNIIDQLARLRDQLAAMRIALAGLQASAVTTERAVSEPEEIVEPASAGLVFAPSRRRMLRRLAGGVLAGLAVGGVAGAMPDSAQAKAIARSGNNRVGAIITAAGDSASNNIPSGTTYKYGLVALSGTGNFDLSNNSNLVNSNAAVYGRSDSIGLIGTGNLGVEGIGEGTGVMGTAAGRANIPAGWV